MTLLNSEKAKLGSRAPDFDLKSVEGRSYTLNSFSEANVLVVMFICSHCPYVQAIESRVIQFQRDYASKSVQLVGICSNDPTDYPEDSPENLRKRWEELNYGFPYLVDETQTAARDFGAVCTPDIFVFDEKRALVYRGQLDDNWKEPEKVTRKNLWEVVDNLLEGKSPEADQSPSLGCSIKWKR